MQDFKFGNVFPEYWGINCFILYEFCSITRLHLMGILEKGAPNVAILMKSLDVTLKFEEKCHAETKEKYDKIISGEKVPSEKKSYALQSLPKFKGSISNSFEPYLKPYVKSEEDAMYEALTKNL